LGEKEKARDTTTISVMLTPVFGITIPAIIRVGESTAKVTISDLGFKMENDTIPRFSMVFNRSGNMSVFGDLTVDHISTRGKITRVGMANGVAVYTPNARRQFQFNLNKVPEVDFIYNTSSDVKPVRLAEAELPLK
jgi:hypothetical protein